MRAVSAVVISLLYAFASLLFCSKNMTGSELKNQSNLGEVFYNFTAYAKGDTTL
jgi:hypothetical protein